MRWTISLTCTQDDGTTAIREVATIERQQRVTASDVGLQFAEAKQITARLQHLVITEQLRQHCAAERHCAVCDRRRPLKDYRRLQIDTVLGRVVVRAPRNVSETSSTRIPAPGVSRVEASGETAMRASTRGSGPGTAVMAPPSYVTHNGAERRTAPCPGCGQAVADAFFHPDCTVGSGKRGSRLALGSAAPWTSSMPPLVGSSRVRDPTTGRESHPAPKALPGMYHCRADVRGRRPVAYSPSACIAGASAG